MIKGMKLSFLGAAHEVTGSCYYLEACGKKILIDCGMEQGPDIYENQEIPVAAPEIDLVLLTHAHIDHSGNLPLLYAQGFRGSIHSTGATAALCDIMLRDSAHIQMFEAEWKNRKNKRAGGPEIQPLYTMENAVGAIGLFVPHAYAQTFSPAQGIQVRFVDVGHLLGSASIELWLTEGGQTRKLVFSGDIGNTDQPIIKNPSYIGEADYVVMESTYGDRSHGPRPDYFQALRQIIQTAFDRGGNVVIPSFAVGRTQELLYILRKIKADRLIRGHENFKVYLDSPLAIEATQVFNKNTDGYFDEEASHLLSLGVNPIHFEDLVLSVSADDSKSINSDRAPKLIISASGMCEAGRIRHHLKHNLWKPENTVLFVGYQAHGTLGRQIIEGAKAVRLFGETIQVEAHIETLGGISGHADREGLLYWLAQYTAAPKRVFVTHGDDGVCDTFAARVKQDFGYEATAPYSGDTYDLLTGVLTDPGARRPAEAAAVKTKRRARSAVYDRLLNAGNRLLAVIRKSEGLSNKDLAKFTDQIDSLSQKWD